MLAGSSLHWLRSLDLQWCLPQPHLTGLVMPGMNVVFKVSFGTYYRLLQ